MPWPVGQSVQGCIKTFRFLCHSPCCGHSIRCYCMSMSYAICLCSTNQATHRKQYDIHTTYNTILIISQGLLSNHGRVFPSQAEVLNLYIQKKLLFSIQAFFSLLYSRLHNLSSSRQNGTLDFQHPRNNSFATFTFYPTCYYFNVNKGIEF